jgi:hypothetical protein
LEDLDKETLLNEFYACHRLKKAIEARTDKLCRAVYNHYCALLVDFDCEDITRFDYYLMRLLLRFELFVKRQFRHINELHDFYDPKSIRSIKPSAYLNSSSVIRIYSETMDAFRRLERIVCSMDEKINMWMYFLYNKRDIPEVFKTEECRKKACMVRADGSYDFKYQLELVYKELVCIIENEMNCDISFFREKGDK